MAGSRNRKSPDSGLPAAVAAVLAAAGVGAGQRVCLALSGGVDSAVLLHLLAGLRASVGFELAAAHVHHGLSPNADAWARACAAMCAAHAVPLETFRVTVARDDPAGLEAAARAARHAALARVERDWLATAHHQDDQAETLLFRLLRGSGVRGAGAMAPVEPGRLRPLLSVRRADIVAYARGEGLCWVEDESNADPRHVRNYLRHEVFPRIECAFPGAVPALARAAEHFREAGELLDALAAQDAAACGGVPFSREALLALPDSRGRNLLRWALRAQGGEAPSRARLTEAIRQVREAPAERPLRLPLGALACCIYRGRVWLEPELPALPLPVPWHGEDVLAWGAGRVRFEASAGAGLARKALGDAGRMELVPPWPGLAMRLAPNRPRRSFKNLCQEAGIPAWLRPRLPVLRVGGEAAWIGEIGTAAELACGPGEEGVSPVWER